MAPTPTTRPCGAPTIPTLDAIDGISTEFVRMQAESIRLEDFRREYLCVHTARPIAHVIDPIVWNNLPSDELDTTSKNLFLAVDATKDRDVATIVAAGRVDPRDRASLIAVEVVEQLPPSEAAVRVHD